MMETVLAAIEVAKEDHVTLLGLLTAVGAALFVQRAILRYFRVK